MPRLNRPNNFPVDIDMRFVSGLLVGYTLGVFNCAVFAAVYLLHRPRYVAPVLPRKDRNGLREVDLYDVGVDAAYPRVGQDPD